MREALIALRELEKHKEIDVQARDLAAFLALTLQSIHETIDISVLAWEKRGYWLKADRFRRDWSWSGKLSNALSKAMMESDWQSIADIAILVAIRLRNVEVPQRQRPGAPWKGAWERWEKSSNKQILE